ncbi:MAG: ATP synthase F0 subunit B [Bdellovibrionales bacterium]|nr:ATP synthase F0 subunit B [Bdellovibrionales bacterium]
MEEHAHHVGPGVMELIQLANLLVVILIGYFGTRKAVTMAVRARSEAVAKKLTESKRELEKVQSELSQAKKEFDQIDQMKNQILTQVRQEGAKLAQSILSDAKTSAERILSDAKVAAEDETRVAIRKLRERVVEEAMTQTLKGFSEASSSSNTHEFMVQKFVSEVKVPSAAKNGAGA